jgi:hypothetical protein
MIRAVGIQNPDTYHEAPWATSKQLIPLTSTLRSYEVAEDIMA